MLASQLRALGLRFHKTRDFFAFPSSSSFPLLAFNSPHSLFVACLHREIKEKVSAPISKEDFGFLADSQKLGAVSADHAMRSLPFFIL